MGYGELLQQNLAAESDYRTTAIDDVWWGGIDGDRAWPSVDFRWGLMEDGIDPEAPVGIRFEVCPACEGRGKYVNPSIDAHGLSREDFDEDPDFRESYFSGDYDIDCRLCFGEKVVPVPLDPVFAASIGNAIRDRWESRAEMLAEMRMGA
jgi:hypothetical protein